MTEERLPLSGDDLEGKSKISYKSGEISDRDEGITAGEHTDVAEPHEGLSAHSSSYETPEEVDELNEHVHDPGDPDGIVAAEERQRWEEAHPAPLPLPVAEYKPRRLWLKALITIVIIVAAAYGAYWIGNHEATKNQTPPKKLQTTQQSKQTQANPNQTVLYTSNNYNLSFNYLKSWVVSDTPSKLTVISPMMALTTATGGKSNVHVVVTIQNPVKTIPGFPTNGAVASLQSQDITYTQPTNVQSAQSYISYLGYTSSTGLDAIYVTGNSGYQQGQSIPMADITQVNPLINIQFESCSDNGCTNSKAVTLNANDWQSSIAGKDVITLIESLQLQS